MAGAPLSQFPVSRVATGILLQGASLFALIDLPFLALLVRRVTPERFRACRLEVILATAGLFFGIWLAVVTVYWGAVYSYLFPAWSRWILPFFQAGLSAAAAMLAWQVTCWQRLHPILSYSLCGAWGILTHIWAVELGIVTRPPLLRGASPVAAVAVAFFGFIFYWCLASVKALAIHAIRINAAGRKRTITGAL